MRNINQIAVLDVDERGVDWSWGSGALRGQHQPAVLGNGNLLIFDNGRDQSRDRWSRVVELDPSSREIVWQYPEDPTGPARFYSRNRGGNQELPNGNILVTDSGESCVFEVTRNREIVWRWHNPVQLSLTRREVIYRMQRLPLDFFGPVLEAPQSTVTRPQPGSPAVEG